MRVRAVSFVIAAALTVLLAVSPVAAAGPFAPATGHWASVYGAAKNALGGGGDWVWNTRIGPDGKLYAFGGFLNASGHATADNLAVWDRTTKTWKGLGSNGAGDGALNDLVYAVTWIGTKMYVAGRFTNAGGVAGADHVAVWNGSSWGRVGAASQFNGQVSGLTYSGGLLYAWGWFTDAGDPTADHVAVWNGSAWSGLHSAGALDGAITGPVYALQALPDGRVYVGGAFSNDGPSGLCDDVCWWDPASESWNPVGGSAAPDNALNGRINAVLLAGSRVYVGGEFTDAGGNAKADYIAVWNGSAWTNVGSSGTAAALNGLVYGLSAYGSNIIATGDFTNAGGVAAADGIAAWNGSRWLSLGAPAPSGEVSQSMITGRTLYMSGSFGGVKGVANTRNIAVFGLAAPPSAPRSLAGSAGSHRVSLSWLAPAAANGSPVSDYVVQYRKAGTATWKTYPDGVRTTRTAAVKGLASHVKYQFRVAARNLWGVGAYSAVITRTAG
jgi:hypothetical protein